MASETRQVLEDYLKTISIEGKEVLDVGGQQLPITERVQGTPSAYKILDLPKYDINKTQDLKMNADMVFLLEVMEYVYNPIIALNNVNRLLKTGGELYISSHLFYPEHKPEGTDLLRYTRHGMIKILNETNFEVKSEQQRLFKNYNAEALYEAEGMRGIGNPNYQGSIFQAIKEN